MFNKIREKCNFNSRVMNRRLTPTLGAGMSIKDLFEGFSKLPRLERLDRLRAMGALTEEDINFLQQGGIKNIHLAEDMIENAIGYFQLPLGIAANFIIDEQSVVIPMAVEETSIIAALSKTAKWIKEKGRITTSCEGHCIIGQIQIARVKNVSNLQTKLTEHKQKLINMANENVAASMVKRGGGVENMSLRLLNDGQNHTMGVIHLTMNTVDAMGANIINQVLEYLKHPIEDLTGETVSMCILSNLNDQKITIANVEINNIDKELGERIEQASIFADTDPYRAATHNKGVLNGIDPVVIATGNDWRAVEAGIHAYAARSGQYRAITRWCYTDGVLRGEIIAPIVVGIVGGVTSIHPGALLSLRMLNVQSASHLSRIIAAVGLVQNLGALRALCVEGITQGHMKLHLSNLILKTPASDHEKKILKTRLEQLLLENKFITQRTVFEVLEEIRKEELKR